MARRRVVVTVGGLKGQVALGSTEEPEEPEVSGDGVSRRLRQHVAPAATGRPQRYPVAAAFGRVDRLQRRVGEVLQAQFEIGPLVLVFLGIGRHAEATADHHVETGKRVGAVSDRWQAHEVAGDVLVVVATDVVGITAGRGGVRCGHARHRPDRVATLLERAGDRYDVPTVHVDIDRVVIGLDAGTE